MTALDALLDAPKPEPQRDRWGRPLIVFPGENKPRALTRVTTLAETLSDRFALEAWACRMTALGIAQRRDLYAQAASLTADDKGKLNEIVEQAKEAAGATAAANTGTALHRITERVDAGETFDIPEPWDADIDAYTATLRAHGIEVVGDLIECFVVNQALEVAGTADRFVRWAGRDRLICADIKSGQHLNFGAIAIQLACYATAETRYDPGTDTHEPMPDVDPGVGLVIHLPAGQARCDIYALDLIEGRRWAKVAAEVREWRKAPKLRPLTPPAFADIATTGDPERAAWLRRRVEWLRDNHPDVLASLAAAWPVGVPTFKADHAHTAAELDLIDAQLKAAEATHGVPFSDEPAPPSRDALATALRALPPDLLAEIEAEAAEAGVPSLASPTVAPGHLEWIDSWLESKARAAVASRGHRLRGAYRDACDEDPEMVPALVATVTAHRGGAADPYQLTEREVDHICALANAVQAGHVQFIATETGWRLEVADPDGALGLLCAERTKTEVRDAGKALATQLSTKAPRSAADVAADPLLFACALAGI